MKAIGFIFNVLGVIVSIFWLVKSNFDFEPTIVIIGFVSAFIIYLNNRNPNNIALGSKKIKSSKRLVSNKFLVVYFVFLIILSVYLVYQINPFGYERPNFEKQIVGHWNENRASEMVLTILNEHLDSNENDYLHRVLKYYHMEYLSNKTIICVAFSRPRPKPGPYRMDIIDVNDSTGNSCHGCGVELSFIEFVKHPNCWKIENEFIRTLNWGQWGTHFPDNWKLLNIGYNQFGFVAEYPYQFMQSFENSTNIYAHMGDEFKLLLTLQTANRDDLEGTGHISSEIQFVKEGTGYYDIVVKKNIKTKRDSFVETDNYIFNGQKYILNNKMK